MNLKKLKYIFLFLAFQAGFFILFSQTSLAADVYILSKTLEDPNAGALYFSQGINTGDFNHDGYQDLVICGKPTGGGNAYVYYGGPSGIGNSPDSTLSGIASKASFGVGSKVYDLNNDGYDDLIVHSDKYNSDTDNHLGKIFIWYGQDNHFSDPADFTYTGSVAEEYFAGYVEAVDLNGDGYLELVVGTVLNNDSMRGRVDIWLGEETLSGSPDYTINGENTGDKFYVLTSGKFNQDGYYDLMVGAEGFSSSKGKIYVYYGGASFDTAVDIEVLGKNTGDRFGKVNAVDLNNDGYDEALVGAWGYDSLKGRVYVYYGPNGIDDSADVEIGTTHSSCYLGIFLDSSHSESSGKINTDDYNDLILSCYSANTEIGELYVHYGGSGQISSTPDLTFSGEETYSRYGAYNTNVDLNNNGYQDLLIGASRYNSWRGRVYVYWGGEELNITAEQYMTGEVVDEAIGSYQIAADFNGDGYQELVIGRNHRTTSVGKVYLYNLVTSSPSLSFNGLNYTNDSTPTITGTLSYSSVNVSKIQYSLDSGGWTDCSPNDGSLGSEREDYYCDFSTLAEGSHSVRVRSKNANGIYLPSVAYASDSFEVDTTSPSLSELAIADTALVSGGGVYRLKITQRMPSFSGKASDRYSTIASGPEKITLNLKKLVKGENPNSSQPRYEEHLSKDYFLSDIQDDHKNEKHSRFYITTPYPLEDGYYQVNLSLKDRANNSSNYSPFYLSLNYQQARGGLPTSPGLELVEEKIPAETKEEKETIKEEGYIVKIKVVDEQGKPVKGAKVVLYSEPKIAYSDENGMVTFANIEPGEHKVAIAYDGKQGEQKINLTGDIQEFHYDIQITESNPFLSLPVILVIGALILSLLSIITYLFYKRRAC